MDKFVLGFLIGGLCFGFFAGLLTTGHYMDKIDVAVKNKTIMEVGSKYYWVAPADPTITYPENPFK